MGPTGPTLKTSGWSSGGSSFMHFLSEPGRGRFSLFCDPSKQRRCAMSRSAGSDVRLLPSGSLADLRCLVVQPIVHAEVMSIQDCAFGGS
jgi:hypothetical protein